MTRLISVLLPEPEDPTSAVVVPAAALNVTSLMTGVFSLYSNQTMIEFDVSPQIVPRGAIGVVGVLTRGVRIS
jgi:hypothetical protein